MIAANQSAGSALWGQLQQLQAERNAEQAERRARSLQSEARQAQSVADRAQERARDLDVRSDQAQLTADGARRGLVAKESLNQVGGQLNELRTQIAEFVAPAAEPANTEAAPPAVYTNAQGQATGGLINVTA